MTRLGTGNGWEEKGKFGAEMGRLEVCRFDGTGAEIAMFQAIRPTS